MPWRRIRIVRDYEHAARIGARRRGANWVFEDALVLSVRTIRNGGARGLTVVHVDDPDGLLDDRCREELAPALLAGQL